MKKNRYTYPAILFFFTAVIITFMIPSEGHFLQRFHLGEKWRSDDLYAPFDFSIEKSEAEIADDYRALERNFIPVYTLDTTHTGRAVASLGEQYAELIPDGFEREFERTLRFIYGKGVAGSIDHFQTDENEGAYIRIEKDFILETVSVEEIFTVNSARDFLGSRLKPYLPEADYNWAQFITPNLTYNEALSRNLLRADRRNIATTKGIVYENDLVVNRDQVVDQETYNKLNSLKNEYRNRIGQGNSYGWVLTGHFMVSFIIMTITFLFMFFFRRSFITKRKNVLFILLLYILMVGVSSAIYRSEFFSIYLIPFAIVPIYMLTFYDLRMSIYEHTSVLLLCSFIVSRPIEFFFINFVAGIVGIYVLRKYYRRDRIFMATGAILCSNLICYAAMVLIQYGGFRFFDFLQTAWFLGNAILFLGMYQLLYIIEKIFGFTSDITLLELGDTNQKLLQELSRKAPGTFQHTLQVANLAEAAAKAIGANALLARTGALYHDIGKIANPAYFIENTNGAFNPHDKLSPRESADIIKKHVTDGVALARRERLPSVIVDFIGGHHGDSLIYYFYCKQKEAEGDADEKSFHYSGSKPSTKEVSICMMADAVEAASRSLTDYTEEAVDDLVERIVNTQIKEGMLAHSALSFNDVARIKKVFKDKLNNIYHTRISYPEREGEEEPA